MANEFDIFSVISVSEENADKIKQDKNNKEKELEVLQTTTIQEIWLRELDELKCQLTNSKMIKINKKKINIWIIFCNIINNFMNKRNTKTIRSTISTKNNSIIWYI